MLGVCMASFQVWHLEGRQVRVALVHYRDVLLTVPVLVPVGLLLHHVELDVGAEGCGGLSRSSALVCRGLLRWPCGAAVVLCGGVGVC